MLEVPWEAGQRPRVGPAPAGKGSYPGSEPLAIKHSASNVGVSYSMSEIYGQTTNCTFLCGPAKITLRSDLPRSGRCLLWTKVFENNIFLFQQLPFFIANSTYWWCGSSPSKCFLLFKKNIRLTLLILLLFKYALLLKINFDYHEIWIIFLLTGTQTIKIFKPWFSVGLWK